MTVIQDMQDKYGIFLMSGAAPTKTVERNVFGLVNGNCVIGANFIKDFFAKITDVTGGKSGGYQKALDAAVIGALEDMIKKAKKLGANAIINIDIDISTVGNSMMMASCYGTAVYIEER